MPEHEPASGCGTVIVGGTLKGLTKALELAKTGKKGGSRRVCVVNALNTLVAEPPVLTENFNNYDDFNENLKKILDEIQNNDNITIFKNTELVKGTEKSEGKAKPLQLIKHSVYIDESRCDNCGECVLVCPVKMLDHNYGAVADSHPVAPTHPTSIVTKYAIARLNVPYCQASCPISMDIRGYIGNIADGEVERAMELISDTNPLPEICGKICTHLCEGTCGRGYRDEPLLIRDLKRYVADKSRGAASYRAADTRNINADNKVAVIGSGPAGLSAAADLAAWGYPVTVFEALPAAGGMLRVGIPDFRLAPESVDKAFERIATLGVEFKLDTPIGKKLSITDLTTVEGYKAVFIAVGAHKSVKLNIEGEDAPGVFPGVSFLRDINLGKPVELGKSVAVIGGGNVATDAARAAVRLGADKVTILYRRGRAEMPAYPEELKQALDEGIELQILTAPSKIIIDKNGIVKAVECIKMKLGEPDESGRRRPIPVEGSEYTIEIDSVIAAIGQAVRTDLFEKEHTPELRSNGTIIVNELTGATNLPGVFAGGDTVSGPASVIEAIRDGKRAACGIDAYIRGVSIEEAGVSVLDSGYFYQGERVPSELRLSKLQKHKIDMSARVSECRSTAAELDAAERCKSFDEVELVMSEEDALAEAGRCFGCRLCIGCGLCASICPRDAIDYSQKDRIIEISSKEILFYPSVVEKEVMSALTDQYKNSFNIITATEFEAMLDPEGPTDGLIMRPFDGDVPGKVAFIFLKGEYRELGEFESIGLIHIAKLMQYVKGQYPDSSFKLFSDSDKIGKLPSNYEHLGDGFDVLKELGKDFVHIPDIVIEEDDDMKGFTFTYTSTDNKEKQYKSDLIVIASLFIIK